METQEKPAKPLGMKAYGSIPHLPNSRLGPGDHSIAPGQARICTEKARDKHDTVIVTEKLDGSCTAVTMVNGKISALGRAGYPARSSKYIQHQMFADWVALNETLFRDVLCEGERLVGEWLAQAHGTRYEFPEYDAPWVVFDLMTGQKRLLQSELNERVHGHFPRPFVLRYGPPISVDEVMAKFVKVQEHYGFHFALDPVEGAVWRVERRGKVDFLAKYVRPDKVDGYYLPEISGREAVWNWRPHY